MLLEIGCSFGSVGIELNSILPSQNPPLRIYLHFPYTMNVLLFKEVI